MEIIALTNPIYFPSVLLTGRKSAIYFTTVRWPIFK